MKTTVTQTRKGSEIAARFPLIGALMGRRARRFAFGASIPDGPLAYTSKHKPMPLDEREQIMVLTAVAGNTGWHYLIPHNPNYVPNLPNYAGAQGGRTFPSAAGFEIVEFFYTDDTGVYFLPTRDSEALPKRNGDGAVDLDAYFEAHRAKIRKLSDKRIHIPASPQHIEMHNPWCANIPGSTLIIPVADLALHEIQALLYLVQNGFGIIDDLNKNPIPGLERFESLIDLDNLFPLSYLEQLTMGEAAVEIGTSCYAGALTLQAMGLGGWMYDGINPFSLLGASGDPEVAGLGFRYDTDDRWPIPNPTGLSGVLEGHCPPHYADMGAAVDAVVKRKFGPGGPFHPDTPGPYRENAKIRGSAKIHDEEFIACVKTMAQYIYERFGKFPGTIPTMYALMYLQAHHLDLDFYDKYYGKGAYLETHANHMENWHGEK